MQPDENRIHMEWVSDRHLRLHLGNDTSMQTHRRVRAAYERLRGCPIAALRDLTPAYATLLLMFDPATLDPERAEAEVAGATRGFDAERPAEPGPPVEIPVCYERECAPDIDAVASLHGLSAREVAAVHCGAEYVVHFIGFSPGFPYLGGLPARLAAPRLERPRTRVPAGSVAVAGGQCGVYPHATPGGWRLIGRTPLRLFDARRDPPALLAMGDRVRFVAIDLERFRALAQAAG
jgi:inhibitor of KinA